MKTTTKPVHLEAIQLGKSFPGPKGPVPVVRDFNLRVREGEFICLIGHSGCGKSTVLSMIAGLESVTAGSIILGGRELAGPGPDRGMVFQSPCLLPWATARQNVMLGVRQVFPHATRAERADMVTHYLQAVGLGDSMDRRPGELSRGMQQRVGLARAFALRPRMLLLDEPFGMLDKLTKFELQEVLLNLWTRTRLTAIMVTHDVDEAVFLADRVVMMTNGPEARVGEILDVRFPRPRRREELLRDPAFMAHRRQLLSFLSERAQLHLSTPADAA